MASNLALTAVKDRRGLNGFGNHFRMNNHQWWGTRRWLIQIVIWFLVVNGPWVVSVIASLAGTSSQPQAQASQTAGEALMIFFAMGALFPAIGVTILGQNAFIQGRESGTIAWVLSKPVSRPAFILSKLSADAIGILVTMVLTPGLVGFLICRFILGVPIPIFGFLGALGLLFLHQLFYLGLVYMLGALFRSRGPVLGIPLVFIFTYQMHAALGWLGKILPWNLVLGPAEAMSSSLAALMVDGQPLPTVAPIIGTAALTLAFVLVALWRFNREEF
jgi:ABC-2 type transport system permease protein